MNLDILQLHDEEIIDEKMLNTIIINLSKNSKYNDKLKEIFEKIIFKKYYLFKFEPEVLINFIINDDFDMIVWANNLFNEKINDINLQSDKKYLKFNNIRSDYVNENDLQITYNYNSCF